MRRPRRTTLIAAVLASLLASTAACASTPTIAGTWEPSDGSGTKVINSDGSCSGMYYSGTEPLDIGGPATCTLSASSTDGYHSMVVRQAPNQVTYEVSLNGDTMVLMSGGQQIVTLTRK